MKTLKVIAFFVGAACLYFFIRKAGLDQILQGLHRLGWGYLPALLYPVTWIYVNSWGWRFSFHREYAHVPMLRLMKVRTCGEAVNSLTPSGYLGGEALKVTLLAPSIPLREATASVLVAKSAQSIALVFYLAGGLALGGWLSQVSLNLPATWCVLAFLTAGVLIFTLLLSRSAFGQIARFLHRLTRRPWMQSLEKKLVSLDASLGAFYRECQSRFLGAIAIHLLGWLLGAGEVWMIMHFLGYGTTPAQAWFISSLGQLGSFVGLIIPAGLGAYEGGHYVATHLLGMDPAVGVTLALIRRVREIFWDAVGLSLLLKQR